ncbi:hypothetical protein [Aeoliella mucimassa]|uniref:Uncharacterized protein n=1 Tax=Aeoliella mucimassa TaxID=2527972 RepID=A0A518ATC0_9BACT|nr:hypothetical protein [Aeoliella mucimassa]QDU57956.1 hypothetical protein Pan181_41800 [Aeoliella mucimassa]
MDSPSPLPSPRASIKWPLQLAAAVLVGALVGMLAAMPQVAGYFRVGVQSLLAGLVLGVMLIGVLTMARAARIHWITPLLAAIVAVFAEHYWLYLTALRLRREALAKQPAAGLFRPGWAEEGFFSYMSSEATSTALMWWSLDACLLAAAAVGIVVLSNYWQSTSDEG